MAALSGGGAACTEPAPGVAPAAIDGAQDVALPPELELPPCEPTVASLREHVFGLACEESTCHGRGTPAWELMLTEEPAIMGLVGEPAVSCRPWVLVVPGRPDESFLYRKVADREPPCGERMPWSPRILPPHALSCLREWIQGLEATDGGAARADAD